MARIYHIHVRNCRTRVTNEKERKGRGVIDIQKVRKVPIYMLLKTVF